MKKTLFALMLMASYAHTYSQACCCNNAGGNYSILPNLDQHVIGLRYSLASYDATSYPSMNMTMSDGQMMTMTGAGIPTRENMNTLDLFGRFVLPKHFWLSVFLPVHILTETGTAIHQKTAGLGDAGLLLQYAVFDTKRCTGKKSKHQLRFGTGIKVPTGKFNNSADGMYTTDLQLGTGSVDFLLNAIYTYRYKQFGFNVLSSYKKNLGNNQQFRFGDKLREGLNTFYAFKLPGTVTLTPTLGVNYDHAFFNVSNRQALKYTGGDYISCSAGFDLNYKFLTFSTTVSPMLMSILNWEGEPVQRFTVETGLYYNFSTIKSHKKPNLQ